MLQSSIPGDLTFQIAEMDSDANLRELILYIAEKSVDDPSFSATKLNKLLYFADFESFRQYGEPITGAEYMRLQNGPVPRRMVPVRNAMESAAELVVQPRMYYGHEQHRPVSLRHARLDLFKARDIAMVDDIIQQYWGKSAKEVSDESHGIVWHVASQKESIPYEASLILDEGYTQDDLARAQELKRQYGWK